MSLKRKASFPTITSPDRPQNFVPQPMMLDDSPKHLHYRTRKRVRNDRPDDQVVYENTLRWLFTAQQRQQPQQPVPTPPIDQDEEMDTLSSEEIVDPRQQTLLQFFRPIQTPGLPCPPPSLNHCSNNASQSKAEFPQRHNMAASSPFSPSGCGMISPAPAKADGDMDMDMDSGSDESVPGSMRWVAELGWM